MTRQNAAKSQDLTVKNMRSRAADDEFNPQQTPALANLSQFGEFSVAFQPDAVFVPEESPSSNQPKMRWKQMQHRSFVFPEAESAPAISVDSSLEAQEADAGFVDYPRLRTLLRDKGLPFRATYEQTELAQVLGKTARAIRGWMSDGKMKFHRWPSRHPYYTAQDIEDLLAAGEEEAR